MPTETANWVGQALSGGRYQVTAKLGEGGMAFVFRAVDRNLGCEVVVKVPRPALLQEPEFASRFAREVRSLVRLAHPHIVKLSDVGTHEGIPFAVMQYLPGGSLRDRLQPGPDGVGRPRPPGELRGWLGDVAEALDFMHREGYLHRDVKPDNILFDQHGHVFLSDFGIAKALAGVDVNRAQKTVLTNAGMVLGTAPYMAPEVLLGEPCDGRADQYALAVTVYQMLSGVVPYDGATPAAIVLQQAAKVALLLHERLPGIPRELSGAVHKAMHRDPRQRFADCQGFARAVLALRSASVVVLPAAPVGSGGTTPLTSATVFPPVARAAPGKREPRVLQEPLLLSGRSIGLLVGGMLGFVACLVLVLLVLVLRGRHDAIDVPGPLAERDDVDRGEPKQFEKALLKKIVPAKEAGGEKKRKDEPGKAFEKKGEREEGTKKGGAPERPLEVPPGPPSQRVVELGTYEPPMPPATAVLLQYQPGGKSEWQRLVRDLKPPRVLTGRPLVSLPAYRSVVKIDRGVRLTLVGTGPEFVLGMPLFESRVVLHQHDALDLDLTLQRGRIVLTNLRADRPARVRLRFENTTAPDEAELWDLTLAEKDTEVLVDRLGFYYEEPFYENPKHPGRKGPVSNLGLTVRRGSIALRFGNVLHTMTGPAVTVWDSRKGPGEPRQLKELPPWTKTTPPGPKGQESVRKDMELAAAQLVIDLSGQPVELGLEKALKATDKSLRKLAIRSFGALDMLPALGDALGDANHADLRLEAIDTLRNWIAASRDNAYTLLAELKGRYTAVEAEKIVSLLHNYSTADRARVETYSMLIDQLVSPKLAIRELSAWHLYRLVPEAQQQMAWSATASPMELQQIREKWRRMIQQGKLPPSPKAPAGG